LGLSIVSRLGAGYIRLVNRTMRWRIEGSRAGFRRCAEDGGVIVAFWHGRLFIASTWAFDDIRTVAMISANRDGELFARTVKRFGIHGLRGSSYDHGKRRDKGGVRAYVQARRELKRDRIVVAITPDGPRGPRMRVQPGAPQLAVETQTPVQIMSFSARWAWTTGGWDRLVVPIPFGRGVQIYGDVLIPPTENTPETVAAFGRKIEEALTEATNRADDLCGRPRIEPAAPDERT